MWMDWGPVLRTRTMGRKQASRGSVLLRAIFCWETLGAVIHVDDTLESMIRRVVIIMAAKGDLLNIRRGVILYIFPCFVQSFCQNRHDYAAQDEEKFKMVGIINH